MLQNSDSLDWTNANIEGSAIWEKLHTKCSSDNTKPAIISNKIQFDKFQNLLANKLANQQSELWVGLRSTGEGI